MAQQGTVRVHVAQLAVGAF